MAVTFGGCLADLLGVQEELADISRDELEEHAAGVFAGEVLDRQGVRGSASCVFMTVDAAFEPRTIASVLRHFASPRPDDTLGGLADEAPDSVTPKARRLCSRAPLQPQPHERSMS